MKYLLALALCFGTAAGLQGMEPDDPRIVNVPAYKRYPTMDPKYKHSFLYLTPKQMATYGKMTDPKKPSTLLTGLFPAGFYSWGCMVRNSIVRGCNPEKFYREVDAPLVSQAVARERRPNPRQELAGDEERNVPPVSEKMRALRALRSELQEAHVKEETERWGLVEAERKLAQNKRDVERELTLAKDELGWGNGEEETELDIFMQRAGVTFESLFVKSLLKPGRSFPPGSRQATIQHLLKVGKLQQEVVNLRRFLFLRKAFEREMLENQVELAKIEIGE